MRAVSITAKTLIAAVFITEGCARAPKREGDLEAERAEILAIEKQWASAIERQDAAAFEPAERRDRDGYREALARADGWTTRLWPDSPQLRERRALLRELRGLPLAIELPTLGTTLDQLRAMRAAPN